jgi:hypothetical protein
VIEPSLTGIALEHEHRTELVLVERLRLDDPRVGNCVQQAVLTLRRSDGLRALLGGCEVRGAVDAGSVLDVGKARMDGDVVLVVRALLEQLAQLEITHLATARGRPDARLLERRGDRLGHRPVDAPIAERCRPLAGEGRQRLDDPRQASALRLGAGTYGLHHSKRWRWWGKVTSANCTSRAALEASRSASVTPCLVRRAACP